MNKTLILTVIFGVVALAGILYTTQKSNSPFLRFANHKYAADFKRYSTNFGKVYGHDEGFHRFYNYAKNKALIDAHNQLYEAGNSTYFLGENAIADMSIAEIKAKLLGYKGESKRMGQQQQLSNLVAPDEVDWTTVGAVNSVKSQGQCGSCWAFSAASALESLNFLKNGQLLSFSEQSLVDCSSSYGNNGCSGGLPDQAFKYVQTQGIASEDEYPYSGAQGQCQSYTPVFQNSGYTDVTAQSESALVDAIAQQPVSVAIEADTQAFTLYAGGIFNDDSCGTNLDHAVIAVGYGQDFFKIRNSWGEQWGEQGYIRLARVGDGPGMCGVLSNPSYPNA